VRVNRAGPNFSVWSSRPIFTNLRTDGGRFVRGIDGDPNRALLDLRSPEVDQVDCVARIPCRHFCRQIRRPSTPEHSRGSAWPSIGTFPGNSLYMARSSTERTIYRIQGVVGKWNLAVRN
jgi:hypothetical protein